MILVPIHLTSDYNSSSISGGFTTPSVIVNPMIKPENVESWEMGLDARFFRNRLGLDVALYTSSTTDQIYPLEIDPIVGAQP